MTNNVTVINSGVWKDQAQQNWCCQPSHARPERYRRKSVREKTTTTKTIELRVLIETENESVVSFEYIWPGMRAKAHRPKMSPQDRNRNPYKSPPTNFCLFYLCCVVISAYYTWASLASSLHMLPSEFASRSYSIPHKTAVIASLCHVQHHTRWQSLSFCINLTLTWDGRVYLSVSTSPSHEMAEFASESYSSS